MELEHVIAEAKDFTASWRWGNQDGPGAAGITSLLQRFESSKQYQAFRATEEGKFLVGLLEQFEEAMNDDWLPEQICGLSLNAAEQLIGEVAPTLERLPLPQAVIHLKETFRGLQP